MMLLFDETPETPQPLSVGELTAQIKDLVEAGFPSVWVSGEISNLARPSSGHVYLTLKDDAAQLKACMWRGNAQRVRFDLHDGLEVICHGHLEVYAPRGQYQLIIHSLEPRGMGALELALRQLREKLAREGLFDPARKKPLPAFVRQIAVVTSPTGAAIHDFLQVLGRRWRGADVLIVPTRVQGEGSAMEIAAAIETANRLKRSIDCLVVTRGGGSLEDLWSFNEEPVVRAIAASRIPVISAIGHEIDVTLADLAADVRALTPSEAAELVAPASEELAAGLRQMQKRLTAALRASDFGPCELGSRCAASRLPPSISKAFRLFAAVGRVGSAVEARNAAADDCCAAAVGSFNLPSGCAQPAGRIAARLQHYGARFRRPLDPFFRGIAVGRGNSHPVCSRKRRKAAWKVLGLRSWVLGLRS